MKMLRRVRRIREVEKKERQRGKIFHAVMPIRENLKTQAGHGVRPHRRGLQLHLHEELHGGGSVAMHAERTLGELAPDPRT